MTERLPNNATTRPRHKSAPVDLGSASKCLRVNGRGMTLVIAAREPKFISEREPTVSRSTQTKGYALEAWRRATHSAEVGALISAKTQRSRIDDRASAEDLV
jgi:hypothetical protein